MNPAADLMQDFLYAVRMIRKRPGFAAVAVTVLALGIGANSAVFSVVNALLLRPVPFPELDRLVALRTIDPRRPLVSMPVAPADYLDWKRHSHSFEHLAAYTFHDYDLTGERGDPEGLRGVQITTDFLQTLRVKPALGRDFRASEDERGQNQVVILSDALWRTRFRSDPAVVGQTIRLDSRPFLVVGVMPADFEFPLPVVRLWTPLALAPADRNERRTQFVYTAARLRDGVSLAQARAEMDIQAQRLSREYPDTNKDRGIGIVLLREGQAEFSKPFLTLLQATALFVLLIACANLANLQLAQAIARRREIAVRAALGAGHWRVLRLLLIESLVIALAGGAVGIAVASCGVALIKAGASPETTRSIMGWNQVALHLPVLAFTLVVAIASGIAFGLSAALQASRQDLAGALKDGGHQGGSKSRLRQALVLAEVMLAMIAVMGASQMIKGFRAMFDVYQGFLPDRILTMRLVLPVDAYDTPQRAVGFFNRMLQSVSAVPNVESATLSSNLPGALHFNYNGEIQIEGRPALRSADAPLVDFQFVGPDYFRTLNIPIRRGRPIGEQDGEGAPLVAVVGERLAARYWPGENPLGKRICSERNTSGGWRTIVGVVGDVHQFWFQKEPRPLLYLPYRQAPQRHMYVALRTRGNPMAVLPAVRERIRGLDRTLPLHDPKIMRSVMQETLSAMRLTTGIMFAFGLLALALAVIGVYGVMAHSAARRHREFGIRMALGARPGTVLRMVVWQGFALTAWGIALGLAAGFAVSRAMAGIISGVDSNSITVLAGVPALLALASLVACWLPARAVTRVDPATVLRQD